MSITPVYPKPENTKTSAMFMFLMKRSSWLEGLYKRSYSMKMGEVRGFNSAIFMVNEASLVKRILVEEWRDFPKHSALHDILQPLLGESIFTTNGEQWQKQRDMLEPSFENVRVQAVFTLMEEAVNAMLAAFDKALEGKAEAEVDIDPLMTFVTADIIFRTILSTPLSQSDGEQIFEAFNIYQQQSPKRLMGKLFNVPSLLFSWWGEKARQHSAALIRSKLAELIKPRYDAFDTEPQDILSSLLLAKDKDTAERFSFEEILNQIAMLFLAGHETSASALMWSLYLLSLDQKTQHNCYEEVAKESITFKSLRRFTHVKNVFKEALRLYPPVGFFLRESKCPITLRGKQIKQGEAILIAPWLIQRNDTHWEKPHEFCPARFEGTASDEALREAYLPFSQGARVCIGASFALQEAHLILSSLLKNYEFLPAPNFTPKPVGRLTIRSDNGMRLIVRKRN